MKAKNRLGIAMMVVVSLLLPVTARPQAEELSEGCEEKRPSPLKGLRGVDVVVKAFVPVDGNTGNATIINNGVEQLLGRYGIRVPSEKERRRTARMATLYIDVNLNANWGQADIELYPFSVSVEVRELVYLARDPNFWCYATTWSHTSVGGAAKLGFSESVRSDVQQNVETFIRDYLAANPKEISEESRVTAELFDKETTWVKCRNPACKAEYQVSLQKYFEHIEKNVTPRSLAPPPPICTECGEQSVYKAVKCAKCGEVFEEGSIPRTYSDTCPHCGYSRKKEERKRAAAQRAEMAGRNK